MKAILLAAGKGTRISRHIQYIPKCVLSINGIPLIRRTVEMLISKNIEPIVCVGYYKEKIYEALEGLDVKYYINPFYDVTNSIASLWFARKELSEDLLIMNADVYFVEEILNNIINETFDSVLMIDKNRIKDGDYFFKIKDNVIEKYGKDLSLNERNCEYVGIGKVEKSFLDDFKIRLEELIDNQKYDLWWENVLYSFVESRKINTIDVDGEFWCEIDYFDDYERILRYEKQLKNN